jgi:hypothetical protein
MVTIGALWRVRRCKAARSNDEPQELDHGLQNGLGSGSLPSEDGGGTHEVPNMNPEVKRDEPTQHEPKSKRLSSLIWIFVLWGGVRACSEMDGISWERAFWVEASFWGSIPATILLCCALVCPLRYQKSFRWGALGAVFFGFGQAMFMGVYFHENTTPAETDFFFTRQLIYPALVIAWVALRHIRESKHD